MENVSTAVAKQSRNISAQKLALGRARVSFCAYLCLFVLTKCGCCVLCAF